ncbi:hypothetical protein [Polaribacter sp.]|uniref:hypothetical protein n=1 Tax=Polaribacter sp. TaxID=1920175 RepID=UPI0040473E96
MAQKKSFSQPEMLEISKIALQNVESNQIIKPLMEALGYNSAKISEGTSILQNTRAKFDESQLMDDNKSKAYKVFEEKRLAVNTVYAKDRKKARIILTNDSLALKALGLVGVVPKNYVSWLENINLFYNTLNNQPDLAQKLLVVQITPTHIADQLAGIAEVESLRAARVQSDGIAQNATKTKNNAFKELEKWMGAFFAIARIALEDEPQLLESLGKFVKS